jgi:excisionase family DNA binding protein
MRTLVGRTMAAQFLGLSPRTVYALTRAGKLPAIRAGRTYKFDIEALKEWLAQSRVNLESEPAPMQPPSPVAIDPQRSTVATQLLGAILAEQRETRRTLVRLANKLTTSKP